ncbi:hypothetical protein [Evtepia sp.]|uniref:hypothetical protein n=1 Tax=Evtepia sp. TaxID=2773933 RepID=UPI002A7F4924|nr:hypothetical protein [Evtepia sp.]
MKAKAFKVYGFVQVQGFWTKSSKPLHLSLERRGAPVKIRIAIMSGFHKNSSKKPFLWNCAATAARINRKAVCSVDIIIGWQREKINSFF